MQNRPDISDLLGALAEFVEQDVRPVLKESDAGLAFRALIAANLCKLLQAELGFEEAQDQVELEGLFALFPDEAYLPEAARAKRSERKAALARANVRLSEEIRSGLDEARREEIWTHVKQTLTNRLMTINPRFDSASDIP